MKKIVIFLIIVIVLLLGIFLFYNMSVENISEDEDSINSGESELEDLDGEDSVGGQGSVDSTGEGSGGSDGGGSGDSGNGINLPLDIETRACGFYFEEYDVCTGSCPAGDCVQEGRSCYCKNV